MLVNYFYKDEYTKSKKPSFLKIEDILDGSIVYEIPKDLLTSWDMRRRLKKVLRTSTYDDIFRLTEWKKKLESRK